MSELRFDPKDGTIFIGVCLDVSFEEHEWIAISGNTEEQVKQDIVSEGYDTEKSFVIRVKLPDTSDVKRSTDTIKVMDIG